MGGKTYRRIKRLGEKAGKKLQDAIPPPPPGEYGDIEIPDLMEALKRRHVRPKEGGALVPFEPFKHQEILIRKVQEGLDSGKPVRFIVVKSRQLGLSTVISMIIDELVRAIPHTQALLISHEEGSSLLIWDHICDVWDMMSLEEKNKKPLYGDKIHASHYEYKPPHGSKVWRFTAGGHYPGVGGTFNYAHLSEFAKWPRQKAIFGTLYQAIPNLGNTFVCIESTAEGQNYFKELVDLARSGKSSWVVIFFSWVEDPEIYSIPIEPGEVFELSDEEMEYRRKHAHLSLTDEQMKFARFTRLHNCGGSWDLFKKEYPATIDEAFEYSGERLFDSSILGRLMELAEKRPPIFRGEIRWTDRHGSLKTRLHHSTEGHLTVWEEPQDGVQYYVGVDPAEGRGGDYSEIVVLKEGSTHSKVVAHYRRNTGISTVELGEIAYMLGMHYNIALIIPEINTVGQTLIFLFSGQIQWVREGIPSPTSGHPYPNMFHETRVDDETGKETELIGVRALARNKHAALSDLAELIASERFWCASTSLLQQCLGMEILLEEDEEGKISNKATRKKIVQTQRDALTNRPQDDGVAALAWASYGEKLTQVGRIKRVKTARRISPGDPI